jgi:alpha-beta hydrolase superfamily lysophospholipase
MLSLALIALLAWLLSLQALAVGLRLWGLALVPRGSARWWSVPLALAGAALFVAFAEAPGSLWAVWLEVGLALALALALSLALRALVPLHPDAPFLPGSEPANPPRWTARAVDLAGELDASALLIEPTSPPPSGRGALVVFSHGGGNDRLYGLWQLFPALLARGHAILTAHMAGHGLGGRDLFSLESARRRLDALLQEAHARAGGRPVLLMGQSMGGAVVLDALARGAEVTGAVTISAPVSLAIGIGVLGDGLALLRWPIYRALRFGNLAELLPPAGPFKRQSAPIRVPPGISYLEAFQRLLVQADLPPRLRAARAPLPPVLVVHGTSDRIVPAANGRAVVAALGSTAIPLFAPARHHIDILFDPQVVAAIADFVDARSRPLRAASAADCGGVDAGA